MTLTHYTLHFTRLFHSGRTMAASVRLGAVSPECAADYLAYFKAVPEGSSVALGGGFTCVDIRLVPTTVTF